MINPEGVRHQIHGNVIQSTSRALMEEVSFDRNSVTSREWGAYPIIKFPDVPKIDVLMLPRQDQPPLGVGESASVPSAAAIANAIFDATGVRFRELPFTPERILRGLRGDQDATASAIPLAAPERETTPDRWQNPFVKRRGALATIGALCAATIGIAAAVLPWRSIAPIARPDASTYSAATIARGQQLAALGDCAVCHTEANGVLNAGGRAIENPVRHDLEHQHHARSRDRNRRVVLSRLRTRDARGRPPRRKAALSGVSLSAFRQDVRRRSAGALRLPDGASAGARREPQTGAGVSVQHEAAVGRMERAVPCPRNVRGRSEEI